MSKCLPTEALMMLHNRLAGLSARHPTRRMIVMEAAQFYGVSLSSIYRALREYQTPRATCRADYNQARLIPSDKMHQYCELIAALKLRTTNKKGHHLSTKECIRLLEIYGIETQGTLIKAPMGLLKKSTVNFYLQRLGLDQHSLRIQPAVVHFQAEQSNECWQFDFSPSDFKHFHEDKRSDNPPTLMIASVVDDRSGVMYQEYHYVYGEDVMTALKFLFNAMSPKKDSEFSFQGIPKIIYMDNGPVAKSLLFQRVMAHLDIEIRTHLPDGKDGRRKTSRSKGKVERPFRTVKNSLEPLYHIHPPRNAVEANDWLYAYLLQRYNQEKHRYENHSRLDDWKQHLPPQGFRAMCTWEQFSPLVREPETRKVGSDACVAVNGVKYQLSSELVDLTVTLLWGMFDNELHVEYNKQNYGPFYPDKGPIPFGQYRPFKKNSREKRADRIGDLAKEISISRAALGNGELGTMKLLNISDLTEDIPVSVPFVQPNPFEQTVFNDAIEAKTAISRYLGYPLGRLLPEQIAEINLIITETLDKKVIMARVKQLFKIRIITQQEGH